MVEKLFHPAHCLLLLLFSATIVFLCIIKQDNKQKNKNKESWAFKAGGDLIDHLIESFILQKRNKAKGCLLSFSDNFSFSFY